MISGFLNLRIARRKVVEISKTVPSSEELSLALAKIMAVASVATLTRNFRRPVLDSECTSRFEKAGIKFEQSPSADGTYVMTSGQANASTNAHIIGKLGAYEEHLECLLGDSVHAGGVEWEIEAVDVKAEELVYEHQNATDRSYHNKHSENATVKITLVTTDAEGYEHRTVQTGLLFLTKGLPDGDEINRLKVGDSTYSIALALHTETSLSGMRINDLVRRAISSKIGVDKVVTEATEGGSAGTFITYDDQIKSADGNIIQHFLNPDQLGANDLQHTVFTGYNLTCCQLKPLEGIPEAGQLRDLEPIPGAVIDDPETKDDSATLLPTTPSSPTPPPAPPGRTPSPSEDRTVPDPPHEDTPSTGGDGSWQAPIRLQPPVVPQNIPFTDLPSATAEFLPSQEPASVQHDRHTRHMTPFVPVTAGDLPVGTLLSVAFNYISSDYASSELAAAETGNLKSILSLPEDPDIPKLKEVLTEYQALLKKVETAAFKGLPINKVAQWSPYLAENVSVVLQRLSAAYKKAVSKLATITSAEEGREKIHTIDLQREFESIQTEVQGSLLSAIDTTKDITDDPSNAEVDEAQLQTMADSKAKESFVTVIKILFDKSGLPSEQQDRFFTDNIGQEAPEFVQVHVDNRSETVEEKEEEKEIVKQVAVSAKLTPQAIEVFDRAIEWICTYEKSRQEQLKATLNAQFEDLKLVYNTHLTTLSETAKAAASTVRALQDQLDNPNPAIALQALIDLLKTPAIVALLPDQIFPNRQAAEFLETLQKKKASYEQKVLGAVAAAGSKDRESDLKERQSKISAELQEQYADIPEVYTYWNILTANLNDNDEQGEDPGSKILSAAKQVGSVLKPSVVKQTQGRRVRGAEQLHVALAEDASLDTSKTRHETLQAAFSSLDSLEVTQANSVHLNNPDVLLLLHRAFLEHWSPDNEDVQWVTSDEPVVIDPDNLKQDPDMRDLESKIATHKYRYLKIFQVYLTRYLQELEETYKDSPITAVSAALRQLAASPHRGSIDGESSLMANVHHLNWGQHLRQLADALNTTVSERIAEAPAGEARAILNEMAQWIRLYAGEMTPQNSRPGSPKGPRRESGTDGSDTDSPGDDFTGGNGGRSAAAPRASRLTRRHYTGGSVRNTQQGGSRSGGGPADSTIPVDTSTGERVRGAHTAVNPSHASASHPGVDSEPEESSDNDSGNMATSGQSVLTPRGLRSAALRVLERTRRQGPPPEWTIEHNVAEGLDASHVHNRPADASNKNKSASVATGALEPAIVAGLEESPAAFSSARRTAWEAVSPDTAPTDAVVRSGTDSPDPTVDAYLQFADSILDDPESGENAPDEEFEEFPETELKHIPPTQAGSSIVPPLSITHPVSTESTSSSSDSETPAKRRQTTNSKPKIVNPTNPSRTKKTSAQFRAEFQERKKAEAEATKKALADQRKQKEEEYKKQASSRVHNAPVPKGRSTSNAAFSPPPTATRTPKAPNKAETPSYADRVREKIRRETPPECGLVEFQDAGTLPKKDLSSWDWKTLYDTYTEQVGMRFTEKVIREAESLKGKYGDEFTQIEHPEFGEDVVLVMDQVSPASKKLRELRAAFNKRQVYLRTGDQRVLKQIPVTYHSSVSTVDKEFTEVIKLIKDPKSKQAKVVQKTWDLLNKYNPVTAPRKSGMEMGTVSFRYKVKNEMAQMLYCVINPVGTGKNPKHQFGSVEIQYFITPTRTPDGKRRKFIDQTDGPLRRCIALEDVAQSPQKKLIQTSAPAE